MRELRVRLLGGLEVDGLASHDIGSRKGRILVAALALARGRPVATDRLADVLWGDRLPSRPNDQVGVLVSRLRGVLGADRLPRQDGGYRLVYDWLDVAEVESRVQEAMARSTHAPGAARAAAAAALALVRGPLLPNEDGDWVETERRAVDRLVAQAHFVAAEAALAAGEPMAAAGEAAKALDADPYDETALQVLLRAHVLAGRPASALAAYARVREQLAEDLGTSPSPATEELHAAILRGELAPEPRAITGMGTGTGDGPRLVGREQELGWLDEQLTLVTRSRSRSRSGGERQRGRLVVVEGEAGIGKTTLVRRWATAVGQAGAFVTVVGCDELGRDLPLQPVLDGLDAHLAGLADDERVAVLGPQRDLVGRLLATQPAPTPAAAAAGGRGNRHDGDGNDDDGSTPVATSGNVTIPAMDVMAFPVDDQDRAGRTIPGFVVPDTAVRHTHVPDPAAARSALFAALLAVVERAAEGRVVVLVVDDAHLAGEATLAWLGFAVRRGRRVLVVAARRRGEGPAIAADDVCVVGPLDLAAATTLVGADRAADLHRRSGGHPLFLVALAQAHDTDQEPGHLPATITEAVERHVAVLGPRAAATLRAAAVLGPEVDVALLADALGRSPAALLDDLEAATRIGILVERSDGFAFVHEMAREATELSVTAARRALLHREAAVALSRRSDAAVEPLTVAHHARRGGDADLAAEALLRAAHHAGARSDHAAAVGLLDEAVRFADGAATRLARARARLAVQDLDGAAGDATAAIAADAGVAGLELAGWISYYSRDFAAALRYAEEGAARADDPELRASCTILAGRVLHSNGDLAAAEARLTDAAAAAPPSLRPLVKIWFGDLRVFQGRWREAADEVDRALLDRTRLVHPFALPHALMTRLRAAALGGQAALALATTEQMLGEMERLGELGARYMPGACNYRAWVLRHLGRGAEADDLNERARALTSASGMEEPFNHATLDLADGRLLAGDPGGAARYLEQLRGLGRGGDDGPGVEVPAMAWHQRERTALLESRLALAEDRYEEAAQLAAALAMRADERGSARHARIARTVEVTALLAGGGEPPALAEATEVLDRLADVAGLEAWRLTAELARRTGSAALAQEAAQRAANLVAATPPEHRGVLERWMQPWLDVT